MEEGDEGRRGHVGRRLTRLSRTPLAVGRDVMVVGHRIRGCAMVPLGHIPRRRKTRYTGGCSAAIGSLVPRRPSNTAKRLCGDREQGDRAMCHPGMAELHSVTAGGEHMNKTEIVEPSGGDRMSTRVALDGRPRIFRRRHAVAPGRRAGGVKRLRPASGSCTVNKLAALGDFRGRVDRSGPAKVWGYPLLHSGHDICSEIGSRSEGN